MFFNLLIKIVIDEFSYLYFQFEAIYHHIDYFHIDALVSYLLLRSILYKKTDLRMSDGQRWMGIDLGMHGQPGPTGPIQCPKFGPDSHLSFPPGARPESPNQAELIDFLYYSYKKDVFIILYPCILFLMQIWLKFRTAARLEPDISSQGFLKSGSVRGLPKWGIV